MLKASRVFLEEDVRDLAVSYALTNGITITRKEGGFDHCPVMISATPFPERLFTKAVELTPLFNRIIDRVARDGAFLRESLSATAAADPFTGRLMDIYTEVYTAPGCCPQPLMLGIHRDDYMLNTNNSEDVSQWEINQVEINTIACSFVGLAPLVNEMHRYLHSHVEDGEECKSEIPLSTSSTDVPAGMSAACERHAHYAGYKAAGKKVCVLFVVQPGEANVSDQRIIEQNLWARHGVKVLRRSLRDVGERGCVDENGVLVVDGVACFAVYFRAGYTPLDYPVEECWGGRALIEKSSAVKCPSIPYHLAGTKKVQQLLSDETVLSRFTDSAEETRLAMSVFAPMSGLAESEKTFIADALANPDDWLMKPQREGGGTLIFKDQMVAILKNLTPSQRDEFILMKKIRPPTVQSGVIRESKYVPPFSAKKKKKKTSHKGCTKINSSPSSVCTGFSLGTEKKQC